MPPRKQPTTLFKLAVRNSMGLINTACYNIEKNCPENEFPEFQDEVYTLKRHLLATLPARLFDILCSERTCCPLRADPRIQLCILTHPNMTMFRKCDLDNGIPHYFWTEQLLNLKKLVVLDLKLICTDEILQVIGVTCLLLEEINIVSKVDVRKSPFNASVLIRKVSDVGLSYVMNLKSLRILAMDPPRNERANRVGRCISQNGIRKLVSQLPFLEELRVESCDIGSTLIASDIGGPFSLKKINCHFASAQGIQKLMLLCPSLREFSLTHLSDHNKDEILQQIANSELRLNKLELSFFSFTSSMQELLRNKGSYLVQLSLWEIESLSLDAIVSIGLCCPNLNSLRIMTQSKCLILPRNYRNNRKMFRELQTLIVGCENFDIEKMLIFFFKCAKCLSRLTVKYQTKTSMDGILLRLLEAGFLKNLSFLWLDCTLVVSKTVVKHIIDLCINLQTFVVDFMEDMSDLQNYIKENNFDLRLDSNY